MKAERDDLVLAFYPHARGFAYVLFEGPNSPIDWGMSDLPRTERTRHCLARLERLLDRYAPDALVVRKVSDETGRSEKAELSRLMQELAERRCLFTIAISRNRIREAFKHTVSPTRYAIAEAIAQNVPILAPFLPPPRKIWNGEDRRMGLFDAAALALALFQANGGTRFA